MIRANSRANYMPPELTNRPVPESDTDPHPAAVPVAIECHYCGYEPPRGRKGRICPKCGGSSWEPVMPEATIDDANDDHAVTLSAESRFVGFEDDDCDEDDENDSARGEAGSDFDASASIAPGPSGGLTRFHVGCRAQQVYVVTWMGGGRVRVVPMRRAGRRTWELTLSTDAGPRAYLYLVD